MIGTFFFSTMLCACSIVGMHADSSTEIHYDQFPTEWCSLPELAKKDEQLRHDEFAGASLILNEIKQRTFLDPSLAVLKQLMMRTIKRIRNFDHHILHLIQTGLVKRFLIVLSTEA